MIHAQGKRGIAMQQLVLIIIAMVVLVILIMIMMPGKAFLSNTLDKVFGY